MASYLFRYVTISGGNISRPSFAGLYALEIFARVNKFKEIFGWMVGLYATQ